MKQNKTQKHLVLGKDGKWRMTPLVIIPQGIAPKDKNLLKRFLKNLGTC